MGSILADYHGTDYFRHSVPGGHSKPLISLSIDANISAGTDLLGKTVADLQQNISFANGKVLGTLKYVDDYTGFSGDPAEQAGNYLALHAASDAGATITAELIGGLHGPVTLDADGILIARVTSVNQAVKFVATKGDVSKEVVYRLASITLETEE